MKNYDVLAIGAHPDDIELGCGASIAKLIAQNINVYAIVLTKGEKGALSHHDRLTETKNSLSYLGVKKVYSFDFDDTQLGKHTGELITSIDDVITELRDLGTNIKRIYTMFKDDRHQDHRAVYDASIVSCRYFDQILCYETPSSYLNFAPLIFEQIHDTFLEKKISAISAHKSQEHRYYMQAEQIRMIARFRGNQSGFMFSEGFIPYKFIL